MLTFVRSWYILSCCGHVLDTSARTAREQKCWHRDDYKFELRSYGDAADIQWKLNSNRAGIERKWDQNEANSGVEIDRKRAEKFNTPTISTPGGPQGAFESVFLGAPKSYLRNIAKLVPKRCGNYPKTMRELSQNDAKIVPTRCENDPQ